MTAALAAPPLLAAALAPVGVMTSVASIHRTTGHERHLSSPAGALAANIMETRRVSAGLRSPSLRSAGLRSRGHIGARSIATGLVGSVSGAAVAARALSVGRTGALSARSGIRTPIKSEVAPPRRGSTTFHPGPVTTIPGAAGSTSATTSLSAAAATRLVRLAHRPAGAPTGPTGLSSRSAGVAPVHHLPHGRANSAAPWPSRRLPVPLFSVRGPAHRRVALTGLLQSSEAAVGHSWPRAQRTAIGGSGRPQPGPVHHLGLTLVPMVPGVAFTSSAGRPFRGPAGTRSATVAKKAVEGVRPPRKSLRSARPIGAGLGAGRLIDARPIDARPIEPPPIGARLIGARLIGGPAIRARAIGPSSTPADLMSAGPTRAHRTAADLTRPSSPGATRMANAMSTPHLIEGSTGAGLVATGAMLAARRRAPLVSTRLKNARSTNTRPTSTRSASPGLTSSGLSRPGLRGNKVPSAHRSGTGITGIAQRTQQAMSAANRSAMPATSTANGRTPDIVTSAPRRPVPRMPAWPLMAVSGQSETGQTGDGRGHLGGETTGLALQATAARSGHSITGTTKLQRAVSASVRVPQA